MRRGSLPRGSAHRLYRSRLPNGFSNLRHHRFRSGSMGNGGERRTPEPKNVCGSRVCTPVRCVRSSPGRVNRSKHARPFQCRRERNSGRLARRRLRVFHDCAVLGTQFDGSCNQRTCVAAGNARDIPGGNIRDGQQQATKEHTRMSVTLEVSQLEHSIEASAEQPAKLQKKMSATMHGNQQSSW